jgi:hydroxylaminobenzene mutase
MRVVSVMRLAMFGLGCRALLQNHLELKSDGLEDQLSVNLGSYVFMIRTRRKLLWHGMFLFFLGLCTGLIELQFSNPRMGLAAHLEGVMNGILLLAIGVVWMEVHLSPRNKAIAYWTVLYGAYANWGFTVLGAILGTRAVSPIASGGRMGEPWQESLVTAGFTSVGVAIIVAALLILWGLRKLPQTQ